MEKYIEARKLESFTSQAKDLRLYVADDEELHVTK